MEPSVPYLTIIILEFIRSLIDESAAPIFLRIDGSSGSSEVAVIGVCELAVM